MINEILIANTRSMIDDLKTVCANVGLGNASSEYKIITEVFLYKFLNDKFLHDVRAVMNIDLNSISVEKKLSELTESDYDLLMMKLPPATARLKREHLISYLFNHKNDEDFDKIFDNTLLEIAKLNIEIFSVNTGGMEHIRLFDAISEFVIDKKKRADFCRALVDRVVNFSFEEAFNEKYDFFSTIFEYLIKDYNKDFGKYAEYYTPHSIASIISRILVPTRVKNVNIYDPAAGTGTLVLALAHEIGEENCTIYTQDISQKSNEFLRLNLILNNLVHSLSNVVHDDTLLYPRHLNKLSDDLMKFDYIVSNPPFNVDFSDSRDILAGEKYKERFWAGVPNTPEKDKKGMQIYLLFIQHIISSLEKGGRAAIVVPTPILTKAKGIETKIRKKLIDDKMLRGVVTMPTNIFATTGTNVSVLFIENKKSNDPVMFVEASILGTKSTDTERNQKTILTKADQDRIVQTFNNRTEENGFSVTASFKKIIDSDYRLSPSAYFHHELKYNSLTAIDVAKCIDEKVKSLKLFYTKELEDILTLTFNQWFLDFEFPYNGGTYKSNNGKFYYNEILEQDIPEGWDVKSINDPDICQIIDCLHIKKPEEKFEDERFYLLSLDNLKSDGQIDISKKYYISKEDYSIWSAKIEVRPLDFIVTNAGRAGAIGMVPEGVKCAIGRNMTAIRAIDISPYYMRQFLKSPYLTKFLAANLDEGSFFKSFNVKSIKKIKVLIPKNDVLEQYLEIAEPIIDRILNGVPAKEEIKIIRSLIGRYYQLDTDD